MEIKRNLTMSLNPKAEQKRIESDCYVEGYATTFDPYVLMRTADGVDINEVVVREAFDNADLSDVILQFDHAGPVYARTGNGTLQVSTDEHGLFVCADLSKTSRSRELFEDIQAGNVTKMSIRCSVDADFDLNTNTNVIRRVKKVYDVSAVSIPANDGTEIVARTRDEAVKEIADSEKRRKIALKLALESK